MYEKVELNEQELLSLDNWYNDVYKKKYPIVNRICDCNININ